MAENGNRFQHRFPDRRDQIVTDSATVWRFVSISVPFARSVNPSYVDDICSVMFPPSTATAQSEGFATSGTGLTGS
jgi:hypothetical protein